MLTSTLSSPRSLRGFRSSVEALHVFLFDAAIEIAEGYAQTVAIVEKGRDRRQRKDSGRQERMSDHGVEEGALAALELAEHCELELPGSQALLISPQAPDQLLLPLQRLSDTDDGLDEVGEAVRSTGNHVADWVTAPFVAILRSSARSHSIICVLFPARGLAHWTERRFALSAVAHQCSFTTSRSHPPSEVFAIRY